MRKAGKKFLIYFLIVAVCYLYTGSAYMSQFYRLMDFYDDITVDIITSGWNYLLQAAGIGIFMAGLYKKPKVFGNKMLFVVLLATGAFFMAISQLSQTGVIIKWAGYFFQLHIGLYSGFYLAMFAKNVPGKHAGISYGAAYAVGSVGTYLLSLAYEGEFLMSKEITAVYFILALLTIGLVCLADHPVSEEDVPETDDQGGKHAKKIKETKEPKQIKGTKEYNENGENVSKKMVKKMLLYHVAAVSVMMFISVVGSGLYYSHPQAKDIDWNLIRAFYALGLILAGFLMDQSKQIGGLCVIASLTYPLIVTALIGDGVSGTVTMALSYAFRGFLTVYYVIAFTDLYGKDKTFLPLSSMGLLISRVIEMILTMLLMFVQVPEVLQLALCAGCFVPLLFLFYRMQEREPVKAETGNDKKKALFGEKYKLTARESEVLQFLVEGLSDSEIAEKCFISNNTVRFHVSNILKKTGTSTRVEAVREFEKF